MDSDDLDPVMLSALEHYAYCPRQCALIHVEQVFEENVFTVRGEILHEKVHEGESTTEGAVRVERNVPLWSERYGLTGIADVVEFFEDGTPYPVEYKSGKRRPTEAADIQLCAQAMCLEEMLGRPVSRGAIYHHASRHRREVECTERLRAAVIDTAERVRQMLRERVVPPPCDDARCPNCSLIDRCMPGAAERVRTRRAQGEPFLARDEEGP